MKFYQMLYDEDEWCSITEQRFLDLVEGHGYYKEGAAISALLSVDNHTMRMTPWSEFKIVIN